MSFSFRLIVLLVLSLTGIVGAKLTEQEMNTLKLQMFLDKEGFTPGYLDGRPGKFTLKAMKIYNRKLGRAESDIGFIQQAQREITQPTAMAVVPSFARRYVDRSLPRKRELQAKRNSMPYRSYVEFMAERYHTSVGFLRKLNSSSALKKLGPRKSLIVPNVEPFLIEKVQQGKMYHADKAISNKLIIIDTKTSQLKIYKLPTIVLDIELKSGLGLPPKLNGKKADVVKLTKQTSPITPIDSIEDMVNLDLQHLPSSPLKNATIDPPANPFDKLSSKELFKLLKDTDLVAAFPITTGKPQFIRRGYWTMKNSIELPSWRYDKKLLERGIRGKESIDIPSGPNNPVGVMWNGLSRSGIGIHGTSTPETIGRSKSAGCIRLSNWDVVRLPALIRPGMKVWLK